jgi:hypothetical protein
MNIFGTNSIIGIAVALWPLWLLLGATLILRIIFEIWLPNTIKNGKINVDSKKVRLGDQISNLFSGYEK